MASEALQTVIDMLRANPPVEGASVKEMRASMDALMGAIPAPDGVSLESVDAGGTPAEWTHAPESDHERALLYFHGGGYSMGSLQSHRMLCADLCQAAGCRVLSLDYRLAPEHPYPAAIEDAKGAYGYLLRSGFEPPQIAIAGDSAGGGLTAATLLALRDDGQPRPAAGVCISPWLDLTMAGESMKTRADVDPMLQRGTAEVMADAYLDGADPKLPYASPIYADLADLPPMLIQVGTSETLLDDSTRFASRAKAAGTDVTLEEWEDMIHVWHCFAALLPEGRQAVDRIGEFLREKMA